MKWKKLDSTKVIIVIVINFKSSKINNFYFNFPKKILFMDKYFEIVEQSRFFQIVLGLKIALVQEVALIRQILNSA